MIKEIQLIKVYLTVCHHYDNTIGAEMQRLSNNFRPKFTDEECITIYLFGIAEGKFEVKAIYDFIKYYWKDWFPDMPKYQNFNRRINFLAPAFQKLHWLLLQDKNIDETLRAHLLDSMPIIVANQRNSRTATVAKELCNKGFCSSKNMYYYGVKLHTLGQKRYETLPQLCMSCVTPASENDITVAKEWLSDVQNLDLYADKMYIDQAWEKELSLRNVNIFTPVKFKKRQGLLSFFQKLYSSAVSRTRQAIASFFNWIHQKTNIQSASKVRSSNGLLSFIFVRLTALSLFYS